MRPQKLPTQKLPTQKLPSLLRQTAVAGLTAAAVLGGAGAVGLALVASEGAEAAEIAAAIAPVRASADPLEPANSAGTRKLPAARPARPAAPPARPAVRPLTAVSAPARASRAVNRAPLAPRDIARVLLAKRGWSGQYSCLNSLWTKESNWRVAADNPSSSAYGIPQALPGSKMRSAGADWRTNPVTQITWGLGYIADRYGTPCSAWSHSRSHNWY